MTLTQKSIDLNLTAEELMNDIFSELEAGDYETLEDTIEVNAEYATFAPEDLNAIVQKIEAVQAHRAEVDEILEEYRDGNYEDLEDMLACNDDFLTKYDRDYIERMAEQIEVDYWNRVEREKAFWDDFRYEQHRDAAWI